MLIILFFSNYVLRRLKKSPKTKFFDKLRNLKVAPNRFVWKWDSKFFLTKQLFRRYAKIKFDEKKVPFPILSEFYFIF